MDIEVNEYVRTKDGYIAKCIEIDTDFSVCGFDNTIRKNYGDKFDFLYLEDIAKCVVKHRKQLIDLIEVGDIVRIRTGLYSSFMEFIDNEECLLILKEQVKKFWAIEEILTKEQFEANCYKVGGE